MLGFAGALILAIGAILRHPSRLRTTALSRQIELVGIDALPIVGLMSFLIGIVFWLYILGELYFGQMDEAVSGAENDAMQRGYFWLRIIVTVGWAIYPLGSFIVSFTAYVDDGRLSLTYNLADFVNRIAFGLAVMATALISAGDRRHSEP